MLLRERALDALDAAVDPNGREDCLPEQVMVRGVGSSAAVADRQQRVARGPGVLQQARRGRAPHTNSPVQSPIAPIVFGFMRMRESTKARTQDRREASGVHLRRPRQLRRVRVVIRAGLGDDVRHTASKCVNDASSLGEKTASPDTQHPPPSVPAARMRGSAAWSTGTA